MFNMRNLLKIAFWFFAITLFFCNTGFAEKVSIPKLLLQSKQLILVISPNENSVQGKAQLFERRNSNEKWQPVENVFPIVLGQKGMTFQKNEGDYKSPEGVFSLGTTFGFSPVKIKKIKMNYLPITNSTVCVDDASSQYYNEIIDTAKTTEEWNSDEQMSHYPGYQYGLVINFNTRNRTPGKGSCVFMHIWDNKHFGTAGCTAMSKQNMQKIIIWLDPLDKPVLVQLSKKKYQQIKNKWMLPNLNRVCSKTTSYIDRSNT